MKILKSNLGVALFCALSIMWIGCQKEATTMQTEIQTNQSNTARLGGVADDNAELVNSVPLLISSTQLEKMTGFTSSTASTLGKPVRGGGTTSDVTPPVVKITSPANGATVSGTVSVPVTATDNVGVSSVSFSVNGILKSTLTAAPYNFSWDASTAANGTHTLAATAKDAKGNSSTHTITVTKNTVVVPPPVLPASYFLVTPPIGDQGYQELTCTPFASVYAARSIEQYYRTSATSYSNNTNIFSVEYVYNQTKISTDCNSGTAITLTLDLMKTKGVCTAASMPYTDGNCSTVPTAAQNTEAANYKIAGYSKLVNTDITGIKTMLYQRHPVIASVVMDNSFINAGPSFIWSSYSGSGSLPHCLVICGYDDAKRAFKVMSSWGSSWGNAGYSWIDYNFFPVKSGYYVYTMNY